MTFKRNVLTEKNNIFSIKKLKVGVASVLVACSIATFSGGGG